MLIDSHCHLFTGRVIQNVAHKPALVRELGLELDQARVRLDPGSLVRSAGENGVDVCLLLPTAMPDKVRAENDRHLAVAARHPGLRSLATLHPAMPGLERELERMLDLGIMGFKLSSFSQRFDPASAEVGTLLADLERMGSRRSRAPVVVLDTFTRADVHFGADPAHLTTPDKLMRLVRRHPGIRFVAAHMGGLGAVFDDLRRELEPAPNLFLDTSNAAHTLTGPEFIELLRMHGPARILFGTDWPWFGHERELPRIRDLCVQAGFGHEAQTRVLGGNAAALYGLDDLPQSGSAEGV